MRYLLLLGALFALVTLTAFAQDTPPERQKRGAYVVKYASAKELAPVLAKHFKDAADIQAGPDGTGNCLLISASPAVFDEVLKTVAQLDRRPRAVAIDVFVVELPLRKPEDKASGLDEKDLNGSAAEVAQRLGTLLEKGKVGSIKRIQLSTLESQPSSLMLGENRPMVSGVTMIKGGPVARSITYRNLGTEVKVTPQVAPDGSIVLDLHIQDSRARESTTATVGMDEAGKPIPAMAFLTTTFIGKLAIPPGKVVLAKDEKVTSKEGEGETQLLVTARTVDVEVRGK